MKTVHQQKMDTSLITRYKQFLGVSIVGLILALALMVAVNVNRVQSVSASDQHYKGHIIDIQENIITIKLDEMDEFPPSLYKPIELRVIDFNYPDPVVTPTAVGECDLCDD